MDLVKGNIVKGKATEQSAMVLAVRKDGTAAKLYIYGPDAEVWKPVNTFTVEVAGLEQCFKCMGSGLYFMGGAVVNGRYTGKTGICYACEGKGKQTDADRLRCHYYWHRKMDEGEELESPLEPNPQQPLDTDDGGPYNHLAQASYRQMTEANAARREREDEDETPAARRRRRRQSNGNSRPVAKPQEPVQDVDDNLIDCKGCGTVHRDDTMCPW